MEVVLKNVKKKDLDGIKSLAKALGFEIEVKKSSTYNPELLKKF